MKPTMLVWAVLTVALSTAACTSERGADGVASLTSEANQGQVQSAAALSSGVEVEEAFLAFTQCLRDEGLDIEDPTFDADANPHSLSSPGYSSYLAPGATAKQAEEFRAHVQQRDDAYKACDPHLDGIVLAAPDPDENTELEDATLEYTACMRGHGIDMPDPDASGSGGAVFFYEEDSTGEDFEEAHKACKDIFARPASDS